MVPRILLLLLLWSSSLAQARHTDFVDDELYQKIMDEMDLEEQQARSLIDGVEADGSLGSKCSVFYPCNTGFDCVRFRCYPSRDCIRDKMEEFNASFDSDDYKQRMYRATGVDQADVISAFQETDGDEIAFAQSQPMQSLIEYMKEHSQPFDQVTEIVDACSGVVSARRLHVADESSARQLLRDNNEQRNLQATPAPSVSNALSVSPAPTVSRMPTGTQRASPTVARSSTAFLGIHLEGGVVFEASLTVAWRDYDTTTDTYVRSCFGAEIGGGIELSFYVAITFDGVNDGWACASSLIDADGGLALYAGSGFGACFGGTTNSLYLEFTIGAGVGAGIGWNICGVVTVPAADTSA